MLTYSTRGFDYADGQAGENSTDINREGLQTHLWALWSDMEEDWGAYWSLYIWLSLWHRLVWAGHKDYMLLQ